MLLLSSLLIHLLFLNTKVIHLSVNTYTTFQAQLTFYILPLTLGSLGSLLTPHKHDVLSLFSLNHHCTSFSYCLKKYCDCNLSVEERHGFLSLLKTLCNCCEPGLYCIIYRWSLTFNDYEFFDFTMVQKRYTFSRNHTLNFDLFLGLQSAVGYFLMLGSGGELQLPVSHVIMMVNNRYTYNHSVPIQPSWFSLAVLYSINYMRYSTLYYKIGFVLDGLPNYRLV